jgi:hypothetical protein
VDFGFSWSDVEAMHPVERHYHLRQIQEAAQKAERESQRRTAAVASAFKQSKRARP